jgi:AraC-like DNA-binding protein
MKITTLPDDIISKGQQSDTILFHNYVAPPGAFYGKSVLNKNAISLVISGEKTMHFAEKAVKIRADEFHFLSRGNCLVSMKLSGKIQFRSILIFFDNSVMTNFYLKYEPIVSKFKRKHILQTQPYITFKKDVFVLHFIASLTLLFNTNVSISNEMKQLKLEELLLHLLEKYPDQLLSFQAFKKKELDDLEIRKAVETNVTNALNIEELAFLCNISLSTFKRRFMKIYHTSPNKWILQKRMDLAKTLLLRNEKPSNVFHQIGYENHSSFSQSFKQTVGMTPTAFQQQQLNVDQQLLT